MSFSFLFDQFGNMLSWERIIKVYTVWYFIVIHVYVEEYFSVIAQIPVSWYEFIQIMVSNFWTKKK